MAVSGKTSFPHLIDLHTAQTINRVSGYSIAPWEISNIPDEWIEVFKGINLLPGLIEAEKAKQSFFEKRKKTYKQ